MKVMVIVKASPDSEAGVMPDPKLMEEMGAFNEKLVNAGVMESGDGLKPSSEGFRVRFDGQSRTVTRGPFAETNELIAGYWVWQVDSMEEALEWVKQCPNPMTDASDIEIRPFYEMSDFADIDGATDIAEQEAAMTHTLAMRKATLNPYLFFGGRCEAAFSFYQEKLGAVMGEMHRFSDAPDPTIEGAIPAGFDNKIMHAECTIGDTTLYGSDGNGDDTPIAGMSMAMTVKDKETAHNAFSALSENGEITMPLQETFWSPLFGQVKDQFGVSWMVMVEGLPEGAQ